ITSSEAILTLRAGALDRPLPDGDAETSDGPFIDRRRGLAYIVVPARGWIEIAIGASDPAPSGGAEDEFAPASRVVRVTADDAVRARLIQRPSEGRLAGEPWGGFHASDPLRPRSRFSVPVLHEYPGSPACGPYTFDLETFLVVTNVSCGAAEIRATLRPEPIPGERGADPIEVGLGALGRAETLCIRVGRLLWMAGAIDRYCPDGTYVGGDGPGGFRGLIDVEASDPASGKPSLVLGGAIVATLAGGAFHATRAGGEEHDDARPEVWIPLASGSAPREAWLVAERIGGEEDETIAIEGRAAVPDLDPPPPSGGRSIAVHRILNPQEVGAIAIRAGKAGGGPASGRMLAWAFVRSDDGLVTGSPVRPGASFNTSIAGDDGEVVTVVNLGSDEAIVRCEASDPSGGGLAPWEVAIPPGAAHSISPEALAIPCGGSLYLNAACACAQLAATVYAAADPMGAGGGEYYDLDGAPLEGGDVPVPDGPCGFRAVLEPTVPAAVRRVIPLGETATFRIALPREAQGQVLGVVCDGAPGVVQVRTRLGGVWFPAYRPGIEVPIGSLEVEEGIDIELLAAAPSERAGDALVEVRCGGTGVEDPVLARVCLTVPGPNTRIKHLIRMDGWFRTQDVTDLRSVLRTDLALGVVIARDGGIEEIRTEGIIAPAGIEIAPSNGNPVGNEFLFHLQPWLGAARDSGDRFIVRIGPPLSPGGSGILVADEEVMSIEEPIEIADVEIISPTGAGGSGWTYDPFWDDPKLRPRSGRPGYRKEDVLAAAKGPDDATIRYALAKEARGGTVRVYAERLLAEDRLSDEFDAKLAAGENEVVWPIDDEEAGLYYVRIDIQGSVLAGDDAEVFTEPVYEIRRGRWAHVSAVKRTGPFVISGLEEGTYSTIEGIARSLLLALIPIGGWGGLAVKLPLGTGAAALLGELDFKESIVGGWADLHTWTLLAKEWREGYGAISSLEGDYRWVDFYLSDSVGIPADRGKMSAFETFGREEGGIVALEMLCGTSLRFHRDILKGVAPAEGLLVTWTEWEWPGTACTADAAGGVR
ncbi:MAG: hypothetical protein JXP34_12635, partial [Planctomycetes bacterium]|nr:hypothetical protein [Planctomycetota bacterium]